jgi:serine/threonine protein kinase
MGVEFLHSNGVIHRDIRPENILFDQEGYCKLADFCMARLWQKDNASDTSGTAGYIAPEVMLREPHSL